MLKVEWIDFQREPQCAPDPNRPNGTWVNLRRDKDAPFCETDLPYPAKRCGAYMISCNRCKTNAMVTTAGRPDDPRHVVIPCKKQGLQ